VVWFTVQLDGREVPVILSTPDLTKQLRGCDGVTVGELAPTKRLLAVYLDAEEPRTTQDRVLFHELLVHGALWESPWERSDATEEGFARAVSDRAFGLLHQLGFRWPRRPAAARNLERRSGAHKKLPLPPRIS